MAAVLQPWHAFAGWMGRQQGAVIEYLSTAHGEDSSVVLSSHLYIARLAATNNDKQLALDHLRESVESGLSVERVRQDLALKPLLEELESETVVAGKQADTQNN